jgi:hypothetical protein
MIEQEDENTREWRRRRARFTLQVARQSGIQIWRDDRAGIVNLSFPANMSKEVERQFRDELHRCWRDILEIL